MNYKHSKPFLLGFIVAMAIVLFISAVGSMNEVGRYQIMGVGESGSAVVLDTRTGAVVRIFIRDSLASRENSIDGETIQQALNQ